MTLLENKEEIFDKVEHILRDSNREGEEVAVIAVTKYVDSTMAKAVVELGVNHIGENRVDKFLEKQAALSDYPDLTWHLIGSLQRRKVKDVINYVDYFHALDSIKLAHEINKRADHPINCFLQVNISQEESKHGFLVSEIESVLAELQPLEKIRLVGVMTMAPIDANETELDNLFSKAHQLQIELQNKALPNMPFTSLSMGMSRDYEVALRNGADFIRIGTAFFK